MQTQCNFAPVTDKTESKPKAFIRRLKQQFVKTAHCRIRWDSQIGKWAVLNEQNQPIRHFAFGLMRNVKFSSAPVRELVGCGGTSSIGIAEGDLIENYYGTDHLGYRNLAFDGHGFLNEGHHRMEAASSLRLLEDRKALYK